MVLTPGTANPSAERQYDRAYARRHPLAGFVTACTAVAVALVLTEPAQHQATAQTPPYDGELAFEQAAVWRLPPNVAQPIDVALAPTGGMYAADGRHNNVQAYDPFGRLIASWDHPPVNPAPDFTFVPHALAVDWVTGRVHILWARYSAAAPGAELILGGLFLDVREADGTTQRPLRALPPEITRAVDVTVDAGSGDVYIYDGSHIHMLDMPAAVVTDVFEAEQADAGVGRLGVLSDGRVALVVADAEIHVYKAGARDVVWPLPGTGVALSAFAGQLHVLLADQGGSPGRPVVVSLDMSGQILDSRDTGDMGLTGPPSSAWPWALETDGTRWVFTTSTDGFFQVRRVGPGDGTGTVDGGPLQDAFAPADLSADLLEASDLALTASAGGGALVLDAYEGRLVAFDAQGKASAAGAAATDALDVAMDDSGAVYLTTASGWLIRRPKDEGLIPSYEVPCDCSLGGRLTASSSEVFVTRSRGRRIAALDSESGRTTREVWLADSVGLWPADITTASTRLYAADLVTTRIHSWASAPEPATVWQAGLLAGPRRIAGGFGGPDALPMIAAVMADGFVELHDPDDGNLLLRWRPTRDDGSTFSITDIALASDGRLLLTDATARVVRVFAPGDAVTPTTPPEPRPTATPSDLSCRVNGSKFVTPQKLPLGARAHVTLTLAADCPARTRVIGADLVLAVDHSGSMGGANLAAARAAARSFVELLDVRYHRVALVAFSGAAAVEVPLTDNVASIIDGLYRLTPEGETNLTAAVITSDTHLSDYGRSDALPVIVLLTDGRHNVGGADPRASAQTARARGVQMYTIGLGADADGPVLRAMAGRDDRFYAAPAPAELFPIYGEILRVVVSSLAGNLVVDDLLASTVELVPRSAVPAALEARDRLRWGRSILPSTGITLTYDIIARESGLVDVGASTVAEYTDADGVRRTFRFANPQIEVIPPTPSPTPPATPPGAIYLPITFNQW